MMESQPIEERIKALEVAVAALQKQLTPASGVDWLKKMDGAFADEPAFDDVIRYGREFRQSDAPPPDESH